MAELNTRYFHFTLGPVQGFVSQARRTRDFWAGSFLLSWLAGVAMAEILRQGGKITFPLPPENYLDWITGQVSEGDGPRQGAIPNRFKAMMAQVPQGFQPKQVEDAVRQAWIALSEHVWACDQLGRVAGPLTRSVWERQHRHFWEISWALADDSAQSDLLDRRKNWRNHFSAAEEGVKCMMMDGWQELSGAERPGITWRDNAGRRVPSELAGFWERVRELPATGMATDLREGEHLCALAYVKRRFARHFASFATTLPGGLTVKGWKLDAGMPSVNYLAAVHWLEALVKAADTRQLRELREAAVAVTRDRDEWDTRIACLDAAWTKRHGADRALRRELLAMDGSLFHSHVRDNASQYGFSARAMRDFGRELDRLTEQLDLNEAPSPFYAVLLMDGDALGKHMSDPAKQQGISAALNAFTGRVPEVVHAHNGYLIYAGGDDVLAVLPLEDALECAAAVRQCYQRSFTECAPHVQPATISAAVEFAHVKMPLTKVLADAHALLDDVAKDQAGRDAVAVRVWVQGGQTIEWAQPWEVALDAQGGVILSQMARAFQSRPEPGQAAPGAASADQFSSKFFHRIRERFALLNPDLSKPGAKGKAPKAVLNEQEAIELLAVDYRNSADNRAHISMAQARGIITPLLQQCRPVCREPGRAVSDWFKSPLLLADGALLLRFLAVKGEE